ncbi:hypothetical protein DFH07DRAFT_970281 [Mycena maculata]|uniref:Uncharacterized protein n=1 Tax=Mycena maculata TaxID=230809 RepID=A0AAD7HSB4_9AGAR|nr:hypothetical protein DFH07DRAFT_970320 [Mycena maculata]KAJ7727133.1 hypothetical protein DFH07DRAFT_970281 [Mycena maculata]
MTLPLIFRILRQFLLEPTWLWGRRMCLWLAVRLSPAALATNTSYTTAPNTDHETTCSMPTFPFRDDPIDSPEVPVNDGELKELDISKEDLVPQVTVDDQAHDTDRLQPFSPVLSSISGVFPSAPELFERYERAETIAKQPTRQNIPPRERSFLRTSRPGWVAHIHPEGALYYFHEDKRIFTDAHLQDNAVFDLVTKYLADIEQFLVDNEFCRHPGVDLVVDFVQREGRTECGYYFVDHCDRVVF